MKLPRLKPAAVQDGIEAAQYLAIKNPASGPAFKRSLQKAWEDIARTPRRFAKLETNTTDLEIRRVILRRFNYLVIYEVKNDLPIVLAVQHASRHPDAWKSDDDK